MALTIPLTSEYLSGTHNGVSYHYTATVKFFSPALYTRRPMKSIERADGVMQQAQELYIQYEPWMKPDDRILAKDRMTM